MRIAIIITLGALFGALSGQILDGSTSPTIWIALGASLGALAWQSHTNRALQRALREQKLADIIQREGEERYRQFFEQNRIPSLIISPKNGRLLDVNTAACVFYGMDAATLTGMTIFEINTLSAEEITAEMEHARTHNHDHFHFRHRIASGEVRDVEVYSRGMLLRGEEVLYSVVLDITERRQAERALRREKRFLEAMFDNFPGLVSLHTIDGVPSRWNRQHETIFGLSLDELHEAAPGLHVHPDDLPRIQGVHERLQSGGSAEMELRVKVASGEYRPFLYHSTVVKLGEQDYILTIGIDMTTQRATERALHQREERLRQYFEMGQFGMVIATPDQRLREVNPYLCDLLGYSHEELVAKTCLALFHPDDHAEKIRNHEQLERGEADAYAMELRLQHRDGTTRPCELRVQVARDEEGNAEHMLAVIHDLSERARAESTEQLAARVLDSTVEGVAITDAQGHILSVNRAFLETSGYREEELAATLLEHIAVEDLHASGLYTSMQQAMRTSGHWSGEVRTRRKDQEPIPQWATLSAVRDPHGEPRHYVAVFHDISGLKRTQQRLEYLANHDPLTGLPNRRFFTEHAERAMLEACETGESLAFVFFDLDNFKDINDSFGHHSGDELLQLIATRLRMGLRPHDLLARQGGDEFILCLRHVEGAEEAEELVARLQQRVSAPSAIEGHEISITTSAGLCLYPQDGDALDTLLKGADTAMFRAKERARGERAFYHREFGEEAYQRLLLTNHLRKAVEKEELEVHYQPQYCLTSREIVGLEALLRWPQEDGSFISPGRFIPLAEESGIIIALGLWTLRRVCAQVQAWRLAGWTVDRVSVNVSSLQIERDNFPDEVANILHETGLPPETLVLELTESAVMRHPERAIGALYQLEALGVQLAIDDFGTGYSSLSYLKRLPIHELKLDRSFVQDLGVDHDSAAIARAVAALGKTLNLHLVAEGIETLEQQHILRAQGYDAGQGFLYTRAVSAQELPARLSALH